MEGRYRYEGPVYQDKQQIDICKTIVCAKDKWDAANKIVHRYKAMNGYASDEDICIEPKLIKGGYIY